MKLIKVMLLAAAVACASGVQAQQRTLKLATQNPKGHPLATGMEKFAELVGAKSGGRIKVDLFPGGVLGSDQANVSALQGGTLDLVVLNSGIMASQAKQFGIYDFPFMFANPREADAVVDGPFGQKLHKLLEDKGIVGLAYWELGFRNITNSKRPINRVEDIAGLKLRVIPNTINVDWVKALDANPTPLPFPELYAALDQKSFDGQENPNSVILANKFYEVQKHLVQTNHQYNPQSLIMSKKVWDSLGADDRKVISEAAVEASRFQRQVSRTDAGAALESLKKNGMQVTDLAPAELAKFRAKMGPVIAKHGEVVGADVVKDIQAELAKIRK